MEEVADLYLLRDGTYATPGECSENDDGVLCHTENGVPVAIDGEGNPETLKKGAVDNMNVFAVEQGEKAEEAAAEAGAVVEPVSVEPDSTKPSEAPAAPAPEEPSKPEPAPAAPAEPATPESTPAPAPAPSHRAPTKK